ncbi:methyltransferase domain-containing protein [Euhalothece natronophila Z-M001]|uniref:Methyltransferase domain-containing protein n=1 Tax=Euhalothece natronophila Z-M001 TaxID=522448 RepID=A0A5B8NM11_9CHRO|nr:class I SAM-dependent methyltransferase [Euhalothece natronophila]QDZ39315.1 methyltransferase domain-containing protein [Euhalothece natronophila Z-M001]
MSDPTPLHDQNPLGRFSSRAENYARYRPTYPETAIALILDNLGDPSELVAADIGAGTGISSRLLAEQGVSVIAVEPNAEMREAAVPHPQVTFQDGNAEATGLANESVDLIIACQAFHWFDPEPSLQEFHRILKPKGRLALMWNDWDESDQFTATYRQLIREASGRADVHHQHEQNLPLIEESELFGTLRHHRFPYHQVLDWQSLQGRALSLSYTPQTGEAHEQLMADLQLLHEQWKGERDRVAVLYYTNVYITEKV